MTVPEFGTPGFSLPNAADIREATVELYNNPLEFPDIGPFRVPDKHLGRVLARFEGCEIDRMPTIGNPEIGSLKAVMLDGNVVRISWFWPLGKGRLRCSLESVRLIRSHTNWKGDDDSLSVDMLIRDIYFEETGKETRAAKLAE
jgi:hypothetical protein